MDIFSHLPGINFNIIVNLLMATACGVAIGMERSARGRQAGVRTYALVSLAAGCVLCAISQETNGLSLGDPASRVIQGLLTGLGFLGAGVIMQTGMNIKGLTTAASIWLTSAIGVICGLGFWALGLVVTLLALLILAGFRRLEDLLSKDHYAEINIKLPSDSTMGEEDVKSILVEQGLRPVEVAFRRDSKKRVEFDMVAVYRKIECPNKLAKKLIEMNGQIEAFEISSSPE